MTPETPRYLRFARALALTTALGVTGCDAVYGCDRCRCRGSIDAGSDAPDRDSGPVDDRPFCQVGGSCCPGVPGPLSPPDLPA